MRRPPQAIVERPAEARFGEHFGDNQRETRRIKPTQGREEIRRRLTQVSRSGKNFDLREQSRVVPLSKRQQSDRRPAWRQALAGACGFARPQH